MTAIGRLTIVSGQPLLFLFRKQINKPLTLVVIAALTLAIVTSIIGVVAIVSEVVQEWSRPFTADGKGLSPIVTAACMIILLYALYWNGKHKLFIKVVSIAVAVMGISFILTMLMVIPQPATVLSGLVPEIPKTGSPFLVIAGMVGTTMAGVCLISRSNLVRENNWKIKDLKTERRDAFIAMGLTFFISACIIASAAGTLLPRGIQIDSAIDMLYTLEPLAGRYAVSFFVVGILAAGLSSVFPNMILLPWLINEFTGIKRDLRIPAFRVMVLLIAFSGLTIPIFGGKPVVLMIASQAINPIIMPLMIVFILLLLNSSKIMGKYTIGWFMNVMLIITLVFTTYMGVLAVGGMLELI
jgi:Mn2+/Fe2+ NRAMP family transporter